MVGQHRDENVRFDPPINMLSLSREKCDQQKIRRVYISHFHADHYFDLPFVVVNAFFQGHEGFEVIGLEPLKDTLSNITREAFGAKTPFVDWLLEKCTFVEIGSSAPPIGSTAGPTPPVDARTDMSAYNMSNREKLTFYRLKHFEETYGFLLEQDGNPLFAYLPDTLWCESMKRVLMKNPSYVLVDLNGETAEANKVHFSESDLLEHALPITGENTKYLVTHLMRYKKSEIPQLEYAVPGMKITMPEGKSLPRKPSNTHSKISFRR